MVDFIDMLYELWELNISKIVNLCFCGLIFFTSNLGQAFLIDFDVNSFLENC